MNRPLTITQTGTARVWSSKLATVNTNARDVCW